MPVRARLLRTLGATLIALVALLSVGLTAPAESPFTIEIRPVFLRLDPEAIAESRAHALALDVHVKFGSRHLRFRWSAIPLTPSTTKSSGALL